MADDHVIKARRVYQGMTIERLEQLRVNPESRAAAVEEIWAQMLHYRRRLLAIKQAHYLIFDWETSESQGDRTVDEHQDLLRALRLKGLGLVQEEK